MNDGGVREQIVDLEARIEGLSASIENCRKIILFSRAAIAVGVAIILAMTFTVLAFSPMVFIASVAAVLGGIVLLGSNKSTSDQATAALRAAELRRAELIGSIDLRLVGERPLLPNGKMRDPSA